MTPKPLQTITLQFIPYSKIEHLTSYERIRKILDNAKEEKIILIEGRLKPTEEAELISVTMQEINEHFKGIELHVIYPEDHVKGFFKKTKIKLVNKLLGDRKGMTIVGPANIIKEIKKDPEKLEMITQEKKKQKKSKGDY